MINPPRRRRPLAPLLLLEGLRFAGLVLVGLPIAEAAAADPSCPAGATPGEAWDRAPWTATAPLDAYLFPPGQDRADKARAGIRTDGVVVLSEGRIVYERYGADYTAETRHLAWSVSKSVMGALIGVAVGEGKVALTDSICKFRPDFPASSCAVTVQHLLEFSSGFDWVEGYEGTALTESSVLAMLYGEGKGDMAAFVAAHPLRDPPGTSWAYSSGDTNVLSAVAGAALSPAHGERYPWALLFDPLGLRSATWERDGRGTYVGSSYLYATPQDLARFGLLLLRDGCWGGDRLLPEGWVTASTAVNGPIRQKPLHRDEGDVQGRQLWLNRAVPEIGQTSLPWPHAPEGAFAALGHWAQSITVIPSHDLVVVRTGDDRDGSFSLDELLRLVLEARGRQPGTGATP